MSKDDDYIIISEDDLLDLTGDDTITITGWDSPLTTSLSGGYSYSLSPATVTSSGSVGSVLSTSTGGLMWNNNPTWNNTISGVGINDLSNVKGHQLHVNGDGVFEGELTVKGVKLSERLDAIEERLGILRPNNDLEGKWEQLKALGDEYRRLEKEILEKEDIWNTLKK